MADDLIARVAHITADILGESAEDVSAETKRTDFDSWDSIAHLNLVVALEDEFSVTITPDDFDRMDSIAAVAELVRERI